MAHTLPQRRTRPALPNACRSFGRNISAQRRLTTPVAVSGEGHYPDRAGSGRKTPEKWKGLLGSGGVSMALSKRRRVSNRVRSV
jgi:hypothetical protein